MSSIPSAYSTLPLPPPILINFFIFFTPDHEVRGSRMAPYHSVHCQFGTSSDVHWVKTWGLCQVAYVQIPAPSFTTCGTMAKLFKVAKLLFPLMYWMGILPTWQRSFKGLDKIIHTKGLAQYLAITKTSVSVSCYNKCNDSLNQHVACVLGVLDQISSNPKGNVARQS